MFQKTNLIVFQLVRQEQSMRREKIRIYSVEDKEDIDDGEKVLFSVADELDIELQPKDMQKMWWINDYMVTLWRPQSCNPLIVPLFGPAAVVLCLRFLYSNTAKCSLVQHARPEKHLITYDVVFVSRVEFALQPQHETSSEFPTLEYS